MKFLIGLILGIGILLYAAGFFDPKPPIWVIAVCESMTPKQYPTRTACIEAAHRDGAF